jgi:hypothetical protein
VGVGGNANALQIARSLHVSDETIDLVFGEHAREHEDGHSRLYCRARRISSSSKGYGREHHHCTAHFRCADEARCAPRRPHHPPERLDRRAGRRGPRGSRRAEPQDRDGAAQPRLAGAGREAPCLDGCCRCGRRPERHCRSQPAPVRCCGEEDRAGRPHHAVARGEGRRARQAHPRRRRLPSATARTARSTRPLARCSMW